MQLARLRFFIDHVRQDTLVTSAVRSIGFCRLDGDAWFAENGDRVADGEMLTSLVQAHQSQVSWRAPNSKVAYFPLVGMAAVAVAEFESPPRRRTRLAFAQKLDRSLQNAQHAFDAAHDQLTGLLNRQRFDSELSAALGVAPERTGAGAVAMAPVEVKGGVWLLALDLDHFKQVNDTHGHLHGDLVLRCLAMRLASVAQEFRGKNPGCHTHVARPGGEEFLVLVSGPSGDPTIGTLAERILRAVSSDPMPSDEEWEALKALRSPGAVIPHVSERKITVSIGIATTAMGGKGSVQERAAQLKSEADAALYRAKTAGRDTVRWFREILQRGGRVLEQHSATSIVAIDIGKNVDVRVGQEFLVYHPDYIGGVPFMFSDGRTRKRLGMYPKVPLGRIIVFDAQAEVSFCRPAAECAKLAFTPGAHLEAVPLGSIAHLLESGGVPFLAHDVKPPELLAKALSNLAKKKGSHFAVGVASLDNAKELEKERGSAFVNDALVALVRSMRAEVPAGSVISQTEPTQFSVVVPGWRQQQVVEKMTSIVRSAAAEVPGAAFGAGCFAADQDYGLPHANALDLARYAASGAARETGEVAQYFTPDVATTIVRVSRQAFDYDTSFADYQRFKELGVNDGQLDNQGALAATLIKPPRLDVAVPAIRRAVELLPKDRVLQTNAGLILFCTGDRVGAWEHFRQGEGADSKIINNVYLGAFALSAYEAVRQKLPGADVGIAMKLLNRAMGVQHFPLAGVSDADLEKARSELKPLA